MARGWESKSVESQMEDVRSVPQRRTPVTPEQQERMHRKQGIELDRKRVARELQETSSPMRKTSLEHALAFLDGELGKLERE